MSYSELGLRPVVTTGLAGERVFVGGQVFETHPHADAVPFPRSRRDRLDRRAERRRRRWARLVGWLSAASAASAPLGGAGAPSGSPRSAP